KNFSSPQKLVQVLKNFPRLKIIVAHLGGYLHWEYALHYIIGKDIFLDTSSTLPFIPKNILKKILNKHDKEKILFGSDYPLFLPEQEKYRILNNLNDNFWPQLEKNSTNFLQIL
ncbi:amidohydrolase family protein, partial [Desulfonauticus submarinus]